MASRPLFFHAMMVFGFPALEKGGHIYTSSILNEHPQRMKWTRGISPLGHFS